MKKKFGDMKALNLNKCLNPFINDKNGYFDIPNIKYNQKNQ
jgi:hypothetical protein